MLEYCKDLVVGLVCFLLPILLVMILVVGLLFCLVIHLPSLMFVIMILIGIIAAGIIVNCCAEVGEDIRWSRRKYKQT